MTKIQTWGIWDLRDKCWLGSETGPNEYRDKEINGKPVTGKLLAQMAASVAGQMQGARQHYRYKAMPLPADKFTFKDKIETMYSAEEILSRKP